MTYIVTDNCIACKYTDCVEVCPVDCFYEGENMLVIHPDECIDCGVCEPECPADAIRPDTEPDMEKWVEFNRKYSEAWPVIVTKKDPLPEAEERDGEETLILVDSGAGVTACPPWHVPAVPIDGSSSQSLVARSRRRTPPLESIPGLIAASRIPRRSAS